jgi:hypothetical protein
MECTCCGVSDSPDGLQGHPVSQHQFLVHRPVGVQNNDLGYRQKDIINRKVPVGVGTIITGIKIGRRFKNCSE